MPDDCPFCDYAGPSPILKAWESAYVIEPLRPITPGHVLVIPTEHVSDFASDPMTTAKVYNLAAQWWRIADGLGACNLITSKGRLATQTVDHFHVHGCPVCGSMGTGRFMPDHIAETHTEHGTGEMPTLKATPIDTEGEG